MNLNFPETPSGRNNPGSQWADDARYQPENDAREELRDTVDLLRRTMIWAWEHGGCSVPEREAIEALALRFGITAVRP